MKQEDKELLLKDLCARLPYGVKIRMVHYEIKEADPEYTDDTFSTMYYNMIDYDDESYEFLPYLRPMSSIASLINAKDWSSLGGIKLIDFYNSNHIDYRGLIEKGLAIEVTEENNPYEN